MMHRISTQERVSIIEEPGRPTQTRRLWNENRIGILKPILIVLLLTVQSNLYAGEDNQLLAQAGKRTKTKQIKTKKETPKETKKETKKEAEKKAENETKKEAEKPKADLKPQPEQSGSVKYKHYGYLSFSIYPGFKRIRLDRENVIGFAENILVTAGSHWVEITAPKGYADTSFKVEVESDKTLQLTVQLQNELTGKLAPIEEPTKGTKGKTGIGWTLLKITFITAGLATGYIAFDQDKKTSDAFEKYSVQDPSQSQDQYDEYYSLAEDHRKTRNLMAVTSAGTLLIGLALVVLK
jgi:hypothetical protein